MSRYPLLAVALALLLAPGAAATGSPSKERMLKLRGTVVKASAEAVSVENALGDLMLTCRVPDSLAELAAEFAPGDRVVVKCERRDGKPASLVRIAALEHEEKPKHDAADIAGVVVEASASSLTIESPETGRTLTCSVPAAYAEKVAKLRAGAKAKMLCKDGKLVALALYEQEKPAEQKLYGRISALSVHAVTVEGEAATLTCKAPAWFAEKAPRFAVGDRVKMMCRGGELTYLEKLS